MQGMAAAPHIHSGLCRAPLTTPTHLSSRGLLLGGVTCLWAGAKQAPTPGDMSLFLMTDQAALSFISTRRALSRACCSQRWRAEQVPGAAPYHRIHFPSKPRQSVLISWCSFTLGPG